MAGKVREERAEARERRRSLAAKPSEAVDETAGDETETTAAPVAAAKSVAATAAAAAIAGALAGAAKALLDRGSSPSEDRDESQAEAPQPEAAEQERRDEPQAEQSAQADEPEDDETDAAPEEDEPQAVPPQAEVEAEPSAEDADDGDHEQQPPVDADAGEPSSDQGSDGSDARSPSDAMRIVDQAREHLKNLLGADAESVSGIERTNGNWSVTFEVVEMRRIPESTDILSSYSAVLDDDGGIVSLTRGRRYRRSQVEEG